MRLHVKPVGWFSSRYRVELGGDRAAPVAYLDFATWRTGAMLELADTTLELRRDPLDGALVLLRDGTPEAQAVKPSVWAYTYSLEWAGGAGHLRADGSWGSVYVLEHEGQRLARMKQSAWGTGRAEGAFPDEWPVERALFVAAVAMLAWRAQAGAAAASA